MRTTLDMDENVLAAIKELARRERKTVGRLASDLMRDALRSRAMHASTAPKGRHGFRPIRAGRSPVTNQLVNAMRDDLGV